MFILYNGKFPGVATMVNEEAWPAGVTTAAGQIPWELPFHFFYKEAEKLIRRMAEQMRAKRGETYSSAIFFKEFQSNLRIIATSC